MNPDPGRPRQALDQELGNQTRLMTGVGDAGHDVPRSRVELDDLDAQLPEFRVVLQRVREHLAPRDEVGVETNIAVPPPRIFGGLLCT